MLSSFRSLVRRVTFRVDGSDFWLLINLNPNYNLRGFLRYVPSFCDVLDSEMKWFV